MKIEMNIKQLTSQTIVEKIEGGSLNINFDGAKSLGKAQQDKVADAVLARLIAALDRLPPATVPEAAKAELIGHAKALAAREEPKEKATARVELFFESLKKCFGFTAEVVTMAVGLSRMIGM